MADTKQISATIDKDLAEWVTNEANADRRTFSEMVGILLEEVKAKREKLVKK
jgi:succinate dehydrogenase flavin-adding protein (antitoxin of CptAB toxin-antitoxin module)